jgi:CDP-glucose 4,6-dehydratase
VGIRQGALEAVVSVAQPRLDPAAWRGKRVLLTGHTGFKGAWMGLLLARLGAEVTGVALAPSTGPSLFGLLGERNPVGSHFQDIREPTQLHDLVRACRPELVIHMAAQALVSQGYADPVGTIASNTMGTVHLLEALRPAQEVRGVLVITSDKVYENREAGVDFPENAPLGGHDPYSASKAAAEILTSAYRRSFFDARGVPVVTARAGNVIGGGDWAVDRLIPDLWRAFETGQPVAMRSPGSVRPWQHVLDPLYGYLLYLQQRVNGQAGLADAMNFGPPREPVRTVLEVAQRFSASLGAAGLWTVQEGAKNMHESRFLSIDSRQAAQSLGWRTALPVDEAVQWTGEWYRAYHAHADLAEFSHCQIDAYAERVADPALQRHHQ